MAYSLYQTLVQQPTGNTSGTISEDDGIAADRTTIKHKVTPFIGF